MITELVISEIMHVIFIATKKSYLAQNYFILTFLYVKQELVVTSKPVKVIHGYY